MGSSGESKFRVMVVAALAAGGLGAALWVLSSRSGAAGGAGGSYKGSVKSGALTFDVGADPHRATQAALDAIRDGTIKSVGGLVFFLRGPAEVVPAGAKLKNAYRIRAPAAFVQYLQESYLPATRGTSATAGGVVLPMEHPMMAQLVACDFALRQLERERATPFDNDNRAHVNLLQQLWVAVGKPLASYARMGKQWTELGFQGEDPATDLRGAGILGLRQLVHFAQRHPQAMKGMMEYNKRVQDAHGDSWYLIAVVSLQITAQLLLQKDHPFYLNHLQVLYDSLVPANASGTAGGSAPPTGLGAAAGGTPSPAAGAAAAAKTISRDARVADVAGKSHLSSSEAATKVWIDNEYASDAEAGLFLLHEKLLLFFESAWRTDEPHVMSYNTYVAEKVFGPFFSSSWSP